MAKPNNFENLNDDFFEFYGDVVYRGWTVRYNQGKLINTLNTRILKTIDIIGVHTCNFTVL